MSYIIVFSGPAANGSQARNAVTGIGATVQPTDHNWGFPDSKKTEWSGDRNEDGSPILGTGELVPQEAEYPTVFITAECDENLLNKAVKSVQQFGFVPRLHMEKSEEIEASSEGTV